MLEDDGLWKWLAFFFYLGVGTAIVASIGILIFIVALLIHFL